MEPITREEYYLAKIAGTYKGKTPEPVTIDEYYLATMAGDYSGNTPQPVTRLQYYMAKVAGVWGGSIPAPVTRLEYYWAAIASGEGKVFPPVTREEHFLVLVADAYSVVLTVVTGNPALLENSKGNRGLESLTLYGKSTQGSTTGAQLFDVSEVLAETWLSTEKPIDEKAVGYWTSGYIPVKTGNYICSSKGSARGWTYDADKNGLRYIANSGGSPISIKEGEAFIRVTGANTAAPQNFMFNEGNSIKPYEPYTGGKPSPSPSYPQEIENAGMDGEIGVTVTGTNLLPFEVGQKGNGFEVFADGVQVDVDRETDIYAVGRNNGNVESGYDEFALMTAGKYYIYSGTQDVYLYVVVWRKGKNVVLGYSVGTNAAQIEIMDGDKFRIFLRTAAAFKGKVKAMITRTPMNATSYEPYKPVQKLIVPTPNGLPGIPVSSGGNYTDEKGQQWVCNTIEFRNSMAEMVQRIERIDFKAESWQIVNRSDAIGGIFFYCIIKKPVLYGVTVMGTISNILQIGNPYSEVGNYVWALTNHGESGCRIGFADSTIDSTEKLTNLLNSLPEAYAMYCLAEPIRTPLSSETIAVYKALRTYSPTTTVINDAGAGMSVGYAKMK